MIARWLVLVFAVVMLCPWSDVHALRAIGRSRQHIGLTRADTRLLFFPEEVIFGNSPPHPTLGCQVLLGADTDGAARAALFFYSNHTLRHVRWKRWMNDTDRVEAFRSLRRFYKRSTGRCLDSAMYDAVDLEAWRGASMGEPE